MADRIYLLLLILYGILCQEIIGTSEEDTRGSSDLLVRNRRVINILPGGLAPTPIAEARYIVNIKHDDRSTCSGGILSHYTVISAANCFLQNDNLSHYTVHSGAAYDGRSRIHDVTSKSVYSGHPPHQFIDGVALITVDPPFQFGRTTGFIPLYEGSLPAGARVSVRGWGISCPVQPAPRGVQRRLRTITLPIMNHAECQFVYRNHYHISEKHICTYEERQYCARTDEGTPLVFNDCLVGIYVWKGVRVSGRNPDVYLDLTRPEYHSWIKNNTLLI